MQEWFSEFCCETLQTNSFTLTTDSKPYTLNFKLKIENGSIRL